MCVYSNRLTSLQSIASKQMTQTQKCQEILQRARQQTKIQLASIGKLDIQLNKIIAEYNTFTATFLDLLKKKSSQKVSASYMNELMDKIQVFQSQMEQISEQKVRLANSLQCSVYADCQQMTEILVSCEEYQQSLAQNEENIMVSQQEIEIEEMFQSCIDEELLGLCICNPQKKKNFTADDKMIMCEGPVCQKRWYHVKCMGISQETLSSPQAWICDCCQKEEYNKI